MNCPIVEPELEIIEPDLPIIDAHQHLFDRPSRRYMMEDYLTDVSTGHNIVASVYVETQAMARAFGPEDMRPLGEVEFANGVAAMSASGIYGHTRVAAGIVGFADLTMGDQIGELLDRSMEVARDRFRGIRQITIEHSTETPYKYMTHRPPRGLMDHPGFRRGFQQLELRGLTFDAAVLHHQLPKIGELADQFPETTIVLNHLGMAVAMPEDGVKPEDSFDAWLANLTDLAARPNVVCKVGGLGMPFWGFGFDERPARPSYLDLAAAWGPYIEAGIELFSPDRCMMQSNFPVDSRTCDYPVLWNTMKHIVRNYSPAEKAKLFHGTAKRVYRLDLPDENDSASGA
ncbi:amidohydrolase family protein [Arthrobacter sp. FW306-2-2C-D06B]|uniref:amidohydrolase family protein n=1 Tax=Arthrobacter sp. FW306-2-2C-D06B TaxID=2879618 RepID=UPI001F21C6A6|nr:amidohydrolase family protein [Arthrobacter sp. FW306-2-2C-D06B]UKA60421.1 amidohydrolase family protein [Arthrobacter sp. FW306-2-2C-D06B]